MYKADKKFNEQMQTIEDILHGLKKKLGGHRVHYVFGLVIKPEANFADDKDLIHIHGHGDITNVIGIIAESLQGLNKGLIENIFQEVVNKP